MAGERELQDASEEDSPGVAARASAKSWDAAPPSGAGEERLRYILAVETVGVIFFRLDGPIVDANDAFLRMSGYSRDDVARGRMDWKAMTPPEFMPASLAAIHELLTAGQSTYEKQYIRKDGTRWWGLFAGKRLGENEAIEFILDISETRRTEAALRASEEQMRLLLESLQDYAILSLDPAGRVTSWNEGARRLTGYAAEEIIGQSLHLLYLPEDVTAGKPDRELQTALATGRSEDESWRVRKDGSRFWANEIVRPLRAEDGALLGFAKISRDLSERKQAEERLRLILESINDYAIFTQDDDGRIMDWNSGAEQVFGFTAEEAIGRPNAIVFTPEDRARNVPAQEMQQARRTGRAADERWHMRKDGSRFYASGVLTPLQSVPHSGYVKVARDLTERRQMEERLEAQVRERTLLVRELVTQLTMSEQEERRRVSSILHDDLQQRLFSVIFQLMALRQALDGGQEDAARVDAAQQIVGEIEEALRKSIQITRELSVDLSPPILHNEGLLAAIRWLAAHFHRQQGLAVEVEAEEALPLLNEDLRVLLFQLVRELLFNVVKHAGVSRARVALAQADGELRIAVSDGGRGITPDHEHGSRRTSQGLLRIEQRLQLLGGRMKIASSPGQGTHITLFVPLQRQKGRNS